MILLRRPRLNRTSTVSQNSAYICEPKRQRTAALQNASRCPTHEKSRQRFGLSSAALDSPRKGPVILRHRACNRPCTAAFTLIEIVISSALMALIVVSAYLCLHAAVSSQKLIEPRATVLQNARVAMALMTADLRCACPLSKEYPFLGVQRMLGEMEADNLDFGTHNYTPRRAGEADFCQVSFHLEQDQESGEYVLWRRRNPTIGLDPLSGGSQEEIARGLLGLRFDYYDGFDWYETWGEERPDKAQSSRRLRTNLAGLPEAVRITLWFDPNPRARTPDSPAKTTTEPPLVFQTVARLNLAAHSQAGSASGSDSGNETTPAAATEGRN
jgi:type II secretion system protein J